MPTQSTPKRVRMTSDDRRQQLLGIALELVRSRPIEEVTVEAVAAIAKVSRTLIFHYFPSLRDLLLACLQVAGEDIITQVNAAVNLKHPDSKEMMRSGLAAFIGYVAQSPQALHAFYSFASSDPEFGAVFDQVRLGFARLLADKQIEQNNELSMLFARGWVALIETVVRESLTLPNISRDTLIEAIIDSSAVLNAALATK